MAVSQIGRHDGKRLNLAWSRMDKEEHGPFTEQVSAIIPSNVCEGSRYMHSTGTSTLHIALCV